MSISKIDFCTDLLLEHFNPSGPINQLSQESTDINRPFVKGKITKGFSIQDQSRVTVNLEGIKIAPTSDTINRESFSFECFQVNCFESTLEETRTNVSNICRQTVQVTSVTTIKDNDYVETKETIVPLSNLNADPEIHCREAREPYILNTPQIEIKTRAASIESAFPCDLDSEGFSIYYARGEKDIEGNSYFADFGYIDPLTEEIILVERNVSFSLSSTDNVLSAVSTEILPREIKVVQIKKLKDGILSNIGLIYGQLEDQFYFPHQTIQFNRKFTDQDVYVEDLCINLLLYLGINSLTNVENRVIYKSKYYSTPEIEFIIDNSFRVLSQLLNTDLDVPQTYSVPSVIKSYTKTDEEYNSLADPIYLTEELKCFEDSCFEESCFKVFKNNNLVNRSIRNKSIAWMIIAFCSYIVNYNKNEYITTVINLVEYLIEQKNEEGLYFKGWDDSKTKDTYSNSLILHDEIETSTNIAILLALLKTFEITQDFKFILEADLLSTNINKYLTTKDNTFKHSYSTKKESIESSIYALIHIYIFKDYKKAKPILNFLQSNLFVNREEDKTFNVIKESDNVVSDTDNVVINNLNEIDDFNQIFEKTDIDNYDSDLEILKLNYLAFSSMTLISNSFNISFFEQLESLIELVEKRLTLKRGEASSLFSAACLINNESILTIANNQFNSLIDFNNYRFSKDLLFNKMVKTLPTNYGWLQESSLNRTTNLGSLLYSIASSEALNIARKEFINRMSSISYMYGKILNNKAEDLGLSRISKESEQELKERIELELTSIENTKAAIESKLEYYDTLISIKDNYRMIQAFTSYEDSDFITNWGEGFLSGTDKASTVLYTINVYQPLEEDSKQIILGLTPAGIKYKFNEIIRFNIGGEDCESLVNRKGTKEGCIGFRLSEEDLGCPNIDLENNDDLANENRGKICREDDETIVEILEPERCDGIITNNQNVIVTSNNNKICTTKITQI